MMMTREGHGLAVAVYCLASLLASFVVFCCCFLLLFFVVEFVVLFYFVFNPPANG